MKKPAKGRFEKRFEEEAVELLVLTRGRVCGASDCGGYLQPSLEFAASVDVATGCLSRKKGRLEWLVRDTPDRSGWGFAFKPLEIYRIRARKERPVKLPSYLAGGDEVCYMVTEVLEEGVPNAGLRSIQRRLSKPVRIEEEGLGIFVLNRQLSLFEGRIDWLGAPCAVTLEPDRENGQTGKRALAALKALYADLAQWDGRLRAYAARSLTAAANEWRGEGAPPVTEEAFAARLTISELTAAPNGCLTVCCRDDGMFLGHIVEVDAHIRAGISDAEILG